MMIYKNVPLDCLVGLGALLMNGIKQRLFHNSASTRSPVLVPFIHYLARSLSDPSTALKPQKLSTGAKDREAEF